MKKLLLLPLGALLSMNVATALSLRAVDFCADQHIKSAQLHKEGGVMTDPVIALGSSERLLLTFDDLSVDPRYFLYRISLCNADWEESNLLFTEYLEGFAEGNLQDYRNSFNTLTNYTFFSLRLPNEEVGFKVSGNYKIQIMDSSEPDRVLLQKCFSITEKNTAFNVQCNFRNNVLAGNHDCSQQMDLKVEYPKQQVINPHTDIKVRVTQNNYNRRITPPSPTFVYPDYIDYSHYEKNLYPGGAEFRQFDISSLEFRSLQVRKIQVEGEQYHVLLEIDAPMRQYTYQRDINGNYLIANARYKDQSNTESDYAQVFFTLLTHSPLVGKIYVFGEFTNWELSDRYLMLYSAERQSYELTLPVKQGYYNYRYVLADENGDVDFNAIEGCSHEAENTYGVYVYYRSLSDRHDRLVNVAWLNSLTQLAKR